MMPRHELIEKMALAIRTANMPVNPKFQSHEYVIGSEILAEAALQTLLFNLPNENRLVLCKDGVEIVLQEATDYTAEYIKLILMRR